MTASKDHFSIDIILRHPLYSQVSIAEALSIKPHASWAVGDRVVESRAKWTYFHACLHEGNVVSDFEDALANVVLFVEKNAAFWTDFIEKNGDVELILNHTINPQEEKGDKCFELHLAPEFLGHLSSRSIGLRVQGWQGSVKRIRRKSTR